MKKSLKIVTILLAILMMIACISTNAFAAVSVDSVVTEVEKSDGGKAADKVESVGGKIVGIVTTVGIIAAVIILMIVGIKYMMGSASEKAEYKKVMIPYIIGAVILFSASAIVKMLASWDIIS